MKQKSWVKAGEEWVDLDTTTFLNIESDVYGRDVITFEYNGDTHSSICLTGNKP